jgi:hypothetical protein
LESDIDNGEIYLAGFNTPIPDTLVDIIKEYHENNYPMEAIINFWKLLMINPDVRVRKSLFDFIIKHDMVLTDTGYFIAYKAVYRKNTETQNLSKELVKYVKEMYNHVKIDWKTSAKKYMVYKNLEDNVLHLTKMTTANDWDEKSRNIQFIGNLDTLYADVQNLPVNVEHAYTDKYSKKMHIQLGVPVIQQRRKCNADPSTDCSQGLHIGSTSYLNWYANSGDAILICYINPANVIAVPSSESAKIRVCEYFPYAEAKYVDGIINIIQTKYYESDYKTYEEKELQKMINKVKANELPIEKAINGELETRSMDEMMAIIQNRIVVLSA